MSKIKEDIAAAWQWLKTFGTQQQKELFRPVYAHIQQLEKRVAQLEKIHDAHMAPQMFTPQSSETIKREMQIEKLRKEINTPKQYFPLKTRLQNMIRDNKVGSDEWLKTLKWNNLTEEKARNLVKT